MRAAASINGSASAAPLAPEPEIQVKQRFEMQCPEREPVPGFLRTVRRDEVVAYVRGDIRRDQRRRGDDEPSSTIGMRASAAASITRPAPQFRSRPFRWRFRPSRNRCSARAPLRWRPFSAAAGIIDARSTSRNRSCRRTVNAATMAAALVEFRSDFAQRQDVERAPGATSRTPSVRRRARPRAPRAEWRLARRFAVPNPALTSIKRSCGASGTRTPNSPRTFGPHGAREGADCGRARENSTDHLRRDVRRIRAHAVAASRDRPRR